MNARMLILIEPITVGLNYWLSSEDQAACAPYDEERAGKPTHPIN